MGKIKSFFSNMNRDKLLKIAAVLAAAIGILYSVVYYVRRCFNPTTYFRSNFYYALIFIPMILVTLYLLRILLFDKEWSYTRVFVIMALSWSFCMQLVMAPVSGPDEVQHYYSAYHASNKMMGIKDENLGIEGYPTQWVQGTTYFYMRAEDYYMLPYVDSTFPYQFPVLANGNFFKSDPNQQDMVTVYISPSPWYRYIAAGLGITIARLLGFGFVGVIFMGRFMNTLLLILVGWLCLKLLPVGKHQMVTFLLFPGVLHVLSSYSYDNMSILFSLLLFTLCLHYSKKEVKLHAWDMLFLGACVAVLIPNKTVYALFIVWIFIIPIKKWWDVVISKKWYEYATVGVMLVGLVFVIKKLAVPFYWYIIGSIFWRYEDMDIQTMPGVKGYTWYYFMDHKLETLKFAWDGIKVDFWFNIKNIVGRIMGNVRLNAEMPYACVIIMLACLLIGMIFIKGKRIPKWQMAVFGFGMLICVISIFIGCLTKFTPAADVGSERVQISFRYLMPVYLTMCVGLGTDAKENKLAFVLLYIQNIAMIFSMCGILYFLLHLRDGMPAPF